MMNFVEQVTRAAKKVGDLTTERARAIGSGRGRGRGRDGGLTDVEGVLLHGLVHVSGGEVGWCARTGRREASGLGFLASLLAGRRSRKIRTGVLYTVFIARQEPLRISESINKLPNIGFWKKIEKT